MVLFPLSIAWHVALHSVRELVSHWTAHEPSRGVLRVPLGVCCKNMVSTLSCQSCSAASCREGRSKSSRCWCRTCRFQRRGWKSSFAACEVGALRSGTRTQKETQVEAGDIVHRAHKVREKWPLGRYGALFSSWQEKEERKFFPRESVLHLAYDALVSQGQGWDLFNYF